MRGQYGRAEGKYLGEGLAISSVGFQYSRPEYKSMSTYESPLPKHPADISAANSYYSKSNVSSLSSYPKLRYEYSSNYKPSYVSSYAASFKPPDSNFSIGNYQSKSEYKSSFSGYPFQSDAHAYYKGYNVRPAIVSNPVAPIPPKLPPGNSNSNSQVKCLTNRDEGQQPTDLGRKVALKPGSAIALPNYQPAGYSTSPNGAVEAYASNTNKGLIR